MKTTSGKKRGHSQVPGLENSEYRDIIVQGDHKGDPRAGAPLLWRQAERAGVVQPVEEKVPGRP